MLPGTATTAALPGAVPLRPTARLVLAEQQAASGRQGRPTSHARPSRPPVTRGGDTLAISLSLVAVLAAAVWVLHRYAGMKFWHGLICIVFGFFLATSSFAPQIRTVINAVINALTGQH